MSGADKLSFFATEEHISVLIMSAEFGTQSFRLTCAHERVRLMPVGDIFGTV